MGLDYHHFATNIFQTVIIWWNKRWIGNFMHACFVLLCFTLSTTIASFYNLKICGNSALSKSIGAIFTTAFAHFISMSYFVDFHISNFIIIIIISSSSSSSSSSICYSDLWLVIFDITIVITLECHQPCP